MIRKILLLLAALFSLGAVLLSAILGAAHWQIRQVEPALPTARDIASALEETDSAALISYINTATQAGPLGTIGHIGVLLEWEGGPVFLLDTGMPPERAIAFGKPMELLLDSGPSETFGAIEVQIGDKVQAIGGIAFTHLHSDHTDGIGAICGAQTSPATIFQTDSQRHLQNFGTSPGEENIAVAVCARAVLDTGIVKHIAGFPGLVAIAVGGHTPGSTVYAARFNGKIWVFAGDITNDMQSLHDNLAKPWLYSTFIVPENPQRQRELRLWLESLDQREEFEVLVAHDILAWEDSEIPSWQPAVNTTNWGQALH
jgi:glyoxylase-like metal-dependent hydrolase (beta-lactamase superfamily II)